MRRSIEEKHKIRLAQKFDYIMSSKQIPDDNKFIGQSLGYADGRVVGLWRKHKNKNEIQNSILLMAQESLEKHFNIPLSIWEYHVDFNTNKIDEMIKEYRNGKEKQMIRSEFPFYENNELLSHLSGVWYAYSYATSPKDGINGIYTIETMIHNNQAVTDVNGNRGRLFLGSNQSIIIKESQNSRDLVSISFNNTEVPYGLFHFTLVSKRNVVRRSMCNFGFFSKEKLNEEEYMKILGGKIDEIQLQMSVEFEERVLG